MNSKARRRQDDEKTGQPLNERMKVIGRRMDEGGLKKDERRKIVISNAGEKNPSGDESDNGKCSLIKESIMQMRHCFRRSVVITMTASWDARENYRGEPPHTPHTLF